ncbi:MAG: ferredoxin [Lautropia sp.]
MKITVNESKCCGAGQCVLAAPDLFDQREDDGVVIVLISEPQGRQQALAKEASRRCPAAAIVVSED